ncbi:unnamed protein product [Menidia menidia]|uniref:(Atlantic silverside) hypothetical protein n=1 Tax=Menidia menidia TaxID=238744 RepID=A0A8S4B2E4_9TELE|nr:unnamed protein product [Menidia menidia]
MQSGLVLATLLCIITWINVVHTVNGPVQNCLCQKWSKTRVRPENVQSYTIQKEGACPIKAIMFKTVKGKIICSNPDSKSAKKIKRKVDLKTKAKWEEKQREEESSTYMTATESLVSTKSSPTRARTMKIQRWKRSRQLKRWQRNRA